LPTLPLHTAIADTLRTHAQDMLNIDLPGLFSTDPQRSERFVAGACGLELDFSRQRLDEHTLSRLLQLAEEAQLPTAIDALLGGAMVNGTERRPALHSALRGETGQHPEVDAARASMRDWTLRLRSGEHRGFRGERIQDVVNIGIGGSDLGPRLVSQALQQQGAPLRCHFVSNVDPSDLHDCLAALDPASTLFIICSKSFRTEETRVNAEAARAWLRANGAGEEAIAQHFLAVSSNLKAAAEFGIPDSNCLPMWDWVGGRYSLWSAVGMAIALATGWEQFEALLGGAAAMDRHVAEAEPAQNLPMLGALIDCWNNHFLGAGALAVLPYCHRLRQLPDYLQQLVMESNGKGVDAAGRRLSYHSAPILWGSAGTIGQHSFHQMLHQGTQLCPMELLLPLHAGNGDSAQHARLVAHCLAQSSVFMNGRSEAQARSALLERGESEEEATRLAPHLAMPGNRVHSLLSFRELDAATLGALLAFWEHRTFLNAQLLGINAFDQWGVELGKDVSGQIQAAMAEGVPTQAGGVAMAENALDPGTRRHLARWRRAQT
jgi:glucose-6-phosphate isomerase